MVNPLEGTRTERAKAAKRARILAAADHLIASQGYDQTTMAQVAERADVAVGTVFQYAASKAELLMAVVKERWGPGLFAATVDPEVADPVEAVLLLLQPLTRIAQDQPANAMAISRELLFGAPGEQRSGVRDLIDAYEQRIADELTRRGHGGRALVTARLVVAGTLIETTRTEIGRSPRTTTTARLRDLVDAAVHGAAIETSSTPASPPSREAARPEMTPAHPVD